MPDVTKINAKYQFRSKKEKKAMKYVIVILTLCLMVVSAYAGTYVENFDDGNFDGWEIFDAGQPGSQWTVEDGILTGRREITYMSDLLFGEEDWRNYSIECHARILEPLDEIYGMALDLRVTYPEGDESKTKDYMRYILTRDTRSFRHI